MVDVVTDNTDTHPLGQPNANGPSNVTTTSLSNTNTGTNPAPSATVAQPGTTSTGGAGSDPINQYTPSIYAENQQMIDNPSLPAGGVVTPVLQQSNTNELLNNAPQVTAQQATAATAQAGQVADNLNKTAAQTTTDAATQGQAAAGAVDTYTANTNSLANSQQATAAVGAVSDMSTVRGQLGLLQQDVTNGTAAWATGAQAQAEDAMAARGMGASSIAGQAITQAIMTAGIQIATTDAQTYANMNLANLNNEQQTTIANAQLRQQAMLSDQAAGNAALQFNAQNQTQVATFFANMMSTIDQFNVSQANAMQTSTNTLESQQSIAQATQDTQANIANANNATAISNFNADQANQTERFNASNQLIVDQSNADWRRTINTNNTTAENTANQTNAANALAISNTAMNNAWQAARDNASWVQTSSENADDRAANLAIAAFNANAQTNLLDNAQANAFYSSLGGLALDLIKGAPQTQSGS